jgi:hypothetical protein
MRISDNVAPVGALTAALVSISCCLPFSIPAALGLAGVSMFASHNQAWLIGGSLLLLGIGVVQLFRRRTCQRRSRASVALLCASAVLVFAVVFLPEAISGFLADHLP